MISKIIILLYIFDLCSLSLANNKEILNDLELESKENLSQFESLLLNLDAEIENTNKTVCYCGENSKCSLDEYGNKSCECPYGYKDVLGFCRDINECENSTNLCPPTEKCVNIPGSYVCGCADGYIHTSSGCSDIDECVMPSICGGANSECVNLPGSFECRCKSGYLSRGGPKTLLICQKTRCKYNSPSRTGYGILGAFFAAVVLILLTILYRKYRSR